MIVRCSTAQSAAAAFTNEFMQDWFQVLAEDYSESPNDPLVLDPELLFTALKEFEGDDATLTTDLLTSVSDWLHFWLLTGQGVRWTDRSYSTYLETVVIVFADYARPKDRNGISDLDLPLFPTELILLDPNRILEDQQAPSDSSYPLPRTVSRKFYRKAKELDMTQRAQAATVFLKHPFEFRTRY